MVLIKGITPYSLGKNVLFDKVEHGENFLILYNNTDRHKQIFYNFVQQTHGNALIFYVSHKTNQLHFKTNQLGINLNVQTFFFNVINDNIIHNLKSKLQKCFNEMEKTNNPMLLISDWSNVNVANCEIFIPFLEDLIKRSKGLQIPGWKREYKGIIQKSSFALVNAFETTNLKNDFVQQLIKLHQRVYLLQENLNSFLLPTISPSFETIFSKSHVLPRQMLEKMVKNNLELVILLFLEDNDKSGYQILKDIASHFHTILSQGTLYPLLYQLEGKNKIVKKDGKGREVIYSLSKETKNQLKQEKENCLKAYQHLASFFENRK